MKQLLRAGKSHLYSFTRTSENRTVEADNPDTPDVVETKTETWYIYTLVYNGAAYFADQVFHLTDSQKALAGDYAQNLSLFLSDGSIQYTEYSGGTIAALGDVRFTDGATEVVYFNQLDQRYANQPYGTDNIGGYGCGPTSMAIKDISLYSGASRTGKSWWPTRPAPPAVKRPGICPSSSMRPGTGPGWEGRSG